MPLQQIANTDIQLGLAYPITQINTGTGNTLSIATNNTTALTIDTNQRVGIGTSSPSQPLDVNGASNILSYIGFNKGGTQAYIGRASDLVTGGYATNDVGIQTVGKFVVATGGGNVTMNLDNNGNLGLGVTPSSWGSYAAIQTGHSGSSITGALFSAGTGSNQYGLVSNAYFNGTNWIYGYSYYASRYSMGDGLHLWYNASSGTAGNTVSFTQAMTLDNSGNFLVGTSSATNASKINFYQSSSTAPVRFEQGGGGNGNQGYASWSTIVQSYPVVSSGTQLIIPFISQGNLNSCTIVRVRGIGARFNTNVPQAFTAEFAVGHLNALYNLTSWGLTGNAASVSSSGMNVIINFTSNYTASTQNGVFVVIEYLTSVPGYSINVSSIAMN